MAYIKLLFSHRPAHFFASAKLTGILSLTSVSILLKLPTSYVVASKIFRELGYNSQRDSKNPPRIENVSRDRSSPKKETPPHPSQSMTYSRTSAEPLNLGASNIGFALRECHRDRRRTPGTLAGSRCRAQRRY